MSDALEGTDADRHVSKESREAHVRLGKPVCATCGCPAVWSEELGGWLHATDRHPQGLPRRMDRRKHEVTTRKWSGEEGS